MNGFRRDEGNKGTGHERVEALKRQDPAASVIGYDGGNRDTADPELWPTTKRTFPKDRWW